MNGISDAQGRLPGAPVAIVDIGSNSVRLVAYETLARTLTPLFNEKVLCGLGKGVATTGLLADDAMEKALAALRCFRQLCRQMAIADVTVVATAATRDASNGREFLARAQDAIGTNIQLIGGAREAELSALGVIAGFYKPDGIVGDLGGGSLELVDVVGHTIGTGVSLPIGGLALSDLSKESPKRAVRIIRDALANVPLLQAMQGRTFYAVGGTWRALAKLHMGQRLYSIPVAHGYVLPAEAGAFGALIDAGDREGGPLSTVTTARRPLLGYGAAVLDEIVRLGRPAQVVTSALGVREGLMFERLPGETRALDPLLATAREINRLRARDPRHGEDLCGWTDGFIASLDITETDEHRRLRQAACLLADIAWRVHPDNRGATAFATLANATLAGISHQGRCFLGLTLRLRYEGLDAEVDAISRSMLGPGAIERARVLAGAMRVAIQLSAAMGNTLPATSLLAGKGKLSLKVPDAMADLLTVRVQSRLRQVAKLLGRDAEVGLLPA